MTSHSNAIVWLDIPVSNLPRAISFYQAVLNFDLVSTHSNPDMATLMKQGSTSGFSLLSIPNITPTPNAMLPYFNCEGRLEQAVSMAKLEGGKVLQAIHSMEPFGHRAVLQDVDGNRFAVHSS